MMWWLSVGGVLGTFCLQTRLLLLTCMMCFIFPTCYYVIDSLVDFVTLGNSLWSYMLFISSVSNLLVRRKHSSGNVLSRWTNCCCLKQKLLGVYLRGSNQIAKLWFSLRSEKDYSQERPLFGDTQWNVDLLKDLEIVWTWGSTCSALHSSKFSD